MKKKLLTGLAVGLMISGMNGIAGATLLTPGTWTPLTGFYNTGLLNGLVVEDDLVPFSWNTTTGGAISGEVQVRVVQSSVDSTYDFYWRVFNDAGSTDAINQFRIGNFNTGSYDANYRTDGPGDLGPDQAYLFSLPYNGYVNFIFSNGLQPGQSSLLFFLDTTETAYNRSLIYDLTALNDSTISEMFNGYAPGAPVPIPATILLMGTGLAGLIGARRKKKA